MLMLPWIALAEILWLWMPYQIDYQLISCSMMLIPHIYKRATAGRVGTTEVFMVCFHLYYSYAVQDLAMRKDNILGNQPYGQTALAYIMFIEVFST